MVPGTTIEYPKEQPQDITFEKPIDPAGVNFDGYDPELASLEESAGQAMT
jgi:hypothetical protein